MTDEMMSLRRLLEKSSDPICCARWWDLPRSA